MGVRGVQPVLWIDILPVPLGQRAFFDVLVVEAVATAAEAGGAAEDAGLLLAHLVREQSGGIAREAKYDYGRNDRQNQTLHSRILALGPPPLLLAHAREENAVSIRTVIRHAIQKQVLAEVTNLQVAERHGIADARNTDSFQRRRGIASADQFRSDKPEETVRVVPCQKGGVGSTSTFDQHADYLPPPEFFEKEIQ